MRFFWLVISMASTSIVAPFLGITSVAAAVIAIVVTTLVVTFVCASPVSVTTMAVLAVAVVASAAARMEVFVLIVSSALRAWCPDLRAVGCAMSTAVFSVASASVSLVRHDWGRKYVVLSPCAPIADNALSESMGRDRGICLRT